MWPLEKPAPDVGVGVFLGDVTLPSLADPVEGERVLLVEPNELQAECTLRRLELGGRHVWFAEIGDPDAIQVIYPESSDVPDAPTNSRHPAKAWRPVFDFNPDINPGELWRSSVDTTGPGIPNFPGPADLCGQWRTLRNASRMRYPLLAPGATRAGIFLALAIRCPGSQRRLACRRASAR